MFFSRLDMESYLWAALIISCKIANEDFSIKSSDDLCFCLVISPRSHINYSLHDEQVVWREWGCFESHSKKGSRYCSNAHCARSNSHIWLPLPHSRNVLWTCSSIYTTWCFFITFFKWDNLTSYQSDILRVTSCTTAFLEAFFKIIMCTTNVH